MRPSPAPAMTGDPSSHTSARDASAGDFVGRGPTPGRATASTLDIDLGALARNWRTLAGRAMPANAAAVVKCDAYGLGLAPVMRALLSEGCARFYVAHAFEGVNARKVAPSAKIYVLNGPVPAEVECFLDHGLVPVLNTPRQAETWRAAARAAGRRLPAVLHIDTGMNRLGLSAKEAAALLDAPDGLAGLDLDHVMSHLAFASTPDHPMNGAQRDAFRVIAERLAETPQGLVASAGLHIPGFTHDIVRLGVALFGGTPFDEGAPPGIEPVVTWTAPILQLRRPDAGETVGYGATHTVGEGRVLAVAGAGYGDGYRRALSGIGRGWVNGAFCPIAGRVSMDLTTFDVTACRPGRLAEGDPIELMGAHVTVDEIAERVGTAPYEVLTGLGARCVRRYHSSSFASSRDGPA